jgi:hypothetical protein
MTVLRRMVYKMEEKRSENRSLKDTLENLKHRRPRVFNVDIEGKIKPVGFYPG